MIKIVKTGLIFLLAILPVQLQAVFTYASHLSNGKQHIYFFNDIHDAYEKAPDQQIEVISFAKALNAKLLTEEMTNTDTLQKYIHDKGLLAQIELDCMAHLQKDESLQFPLRGLALLARSLSVDAKNIDYRQWVDAFRTGRAITGKKAMHVLDTVINEVKSYDDSPLFNAYYKEVVDMITDVFKPLWDYLRTKDIPVAELVKTEEFKTIVAAIDNDPRKKELKYSDYWIAYDAALFDCLLLHALTQHKDEHIVVCAGGLHCDKASELLQESGFEKIYDSGQQMLNPHPVMVSGFANIVLKDNFESCVTTQVRKEMLCNAIQDVVKNATMVKTMTFVDVGLMGIMLLLITGGVIITYIFLARRRNYRL